MIPPGQPDPSPFVNRPPPVVPDYDILRCIGRGGYGEVWLGRNTLGSFRAVKVIYRDSFDSERPYLREFAGIRQYEPVSSHESQVRVYHVGQNEVEGYFYYVMDLADDASLAARSAESATPEQSVEAMAPPDSRSVGHEHYVPATLSLRLLEQGGRLPVEECLPIAIALASALSHLHQHRLVHRDIKPSNIIFVNGRPKLADIGLVTSTSNANTLVGTAGFIPPEGPGAPQADIYSFGKVLYEMAVGRDRQDFPQLPEDLASFPDGDQLVELNEVILQACEIAPANRYKSAAELLADLVRLQQGQSLRKRRQLKRQLVVLSFTGAVMLLLAAGVVVWRERMPGHRNSLAKETTRAVLPDEASTAAPLASPISPTNSTVALIPVIAEAKPPATNAVGQTGCVTPPPGLIAWWPGDGHARDMVENHHGESINGADYGPGLIGRAFRVSGTNQYFSIPHTPSLSFTNGESFTLEAWVFRTRTWLPFHVMGKRDPRDATGYQIGYDGSSPTVPLRKWTHLVDTWENGIERRYINGAFEHGNVHKVKTGPNNANLTIGYSGPYGGFAGLIDDVRIYNRALAPSEIKAIYEAGSNGMCYPPSKKVSALPARWTNTLGMIFVPVPGTEVRFCIWETRVRDFTAFIESASHQATTSAVRSGLPSSPDATWRNPGFPQTHLHPVCAVTWEDAQAYCRWLTATEHSAGRLPANQHYRLPTDLEWSRAVGLPAEAGRTPEERSAKLRDIFPWGKTWPPPPKAGNYAGEESGMLDPLAGYNDGFPRTSPVGSFPPNRFGLYDLGGNVSELCEDWLSDKHDRRVNRGTSWDAAHPDLIRSSCRHGLPTGLAATSIGFRVVLAPN